MAEKSKLSPVMQQYVDFKAENPSALLMFRLGDFYEAFFDDAKTISESLNLVLTHRGTDADGEDVPMCGIPWHASENYFGRLVKLGFCVALVEQMETPAQAKQNGHKFIERKITRVLTPGTLTDDNLLVAKNSNFLIALYPDSDSVFEIMGCDISTGELFIGKTDSVIDDMTRINPAEIIYPESYAENQTIKILRNTYKTTPVYEKLYVRSDISSIIKNVFGNDILLDEPYSVINILAGYLFNTQRGTNITFRSPYLFKSGKQLVIDSSTWKSLEIDAPINENGKCLLDVLDKTKTSFGARKLRSYLRTLSGDINVIKTRQNHIAYLLSNKQSVSVIGNILSNIPDVSRALSRLLSSRGTPRDMRNVMEFLSVLPNVRDLYTLLDSDLSKSFIAIDSHDDITTELKSALADELPTFFRDGNIIKSGFNSDLDNLRALSNGGIDTVANLQSKYISPNSAHASWSSI
ncbi:MAG: hypothetical protein MJ158_03615 [Alphaproteobacteria bacterium]|nr:hypothetical protein [Alphaproteobacteria bacterium]